MRRAPAWLLLVAACGDGDARPDPPRPPAAPPMPWSGTRPEPWSLELHMPKAWTEQTVPYSEGGELRELHFFGPKDDAWHPQLQFGWMMSHQSLDAFGGHRIRTFEDSPLHKVQRKGTTTVGGMPALYCVYYDEMKLPGGEARELYNVVFYFVGHGHIGFVRGVCTARTAWKYAPIFEDAARRLRYVAR